jgi:hypothetical protein
MGSSLNPEGLPLEVPMMRHGRDLHSILEWASRFPREFVVDGHRGYETLIEAAGLQLALALDGFRRSREDLPSEPRAFILSRHPSGP